MTQRFSPTPTSSLTGFTEPAAVFNVLVKDSRIVSVSAEPISAPEATVIDAGGRTLMPGLIDAHAQSPGCR
jgi:imidazolonepropionase-like amidohydrolase